MYNENKLPLPFLLIGTEKICKVGLQDKKTLLFFPKQKRRGEERLEREIILSLEEFEYKAFLLREQLLAMSGYR